MLKEFKEFISRGNVIDLAVGVVIGGRFYSHSQFPGKRYSDAADLSVDRRTGFQRVDCAAGGRAGCCWQSTSARSCRR